MRRDIHFQKASPRVGPVAADRQIALGVGRFVIEQLEQPPILERQNAGDQLDQPVRLDGLSDVVISRAGASTIFELSYFKKPAVLVPYPFSAGGHQWRNAAHAEEIGGAYVISNDELNGERLHAVLKELREQPELRTRMAQNMATIYVENAEELIVRGMTQRVS